MPIAVSTIKNQTAVFPISFEGEQAKVLYRVGDATPGWLDSAQTKPVRRLLAEVLSAWDVLGEDNLPLQPPAIDDLAFWHAALATRDVARREAEALAAEAVGEVPSESNGKKGRAIPKNAWNGAQVKAVYIEAWEAILIELPQPFLRTVFDGLLEDLLPGKTPAAS